MNEGPSSTPVPSLGGVKTAWRSEPSLFITQILWLAMNANRLPSGEGLTMK
jgi:hypothetical protein